MVPVLFSADRRHAATVRAVPAGAVPRPSRSSVSIIDDTVLSGGRHPLRMTLYPFPCCSLDLSPFEYFTDPSRALALLESEEHRAYGLEIRGKEARIIFIPEEWPPERIIRCGATHYAALVFVSASDYERYGVLADLPQDMRKFRAHDVLAALGSPGGTAELINAWLKGRLWQPVFAEAGPEGSDTVYGGRYYTRLRDAVSAARRLGLSQCGADCRFTERMLPPSGQEGSLTGAVPV